MANFPNMEQVGAEIDSRLTTLETNNANYLTKTTADAAYLGINAKAASATKADSATKATQDGSGNVITDTYLTKNSAATTYLGINAKAASASTAVPHQLLMQRMRQMLLKQRRMVTAITL